MLEEDVHPQATEQLPARAWCLARLREHLADAVLDSGRAVEDVAAGYGVAWRTVQDAVDAAVVELPEVDTLRVRHLGVDDRIEVVAVDPQSSSDKTRPIPNRLDACRYGNMMAAVARAATTSDAFNAIAEPQRRDSLALLRAGERPVTDLAQELGMSQPRASKHLRVLREVGLVRVRGAGKQRLYGLDARGLRPVHEWVGGFERFWNESFDRLDTYVQDLKQTRQEE